MATAPPPTALYLSLLHGALTTTMPASPRVKPHLASIVLMTWHYTCSHPNFLLRRIMKQSTLSVIDWQGLARDTVCASEIDIFTKHYKYKHTVASVK